MEKMKIGITDVTGEYRVYEIEIDSTLTGENYENAVIEAIVPLMVLDIGRPSNTWQDENGGGCDLKPELKHKPLPADHYPEQTDIVGGHFGIN